MALKNGQLDEFVETTVRETARLSADLENLTDQFNDHRQDTTIKYSRIDNKLDDIKNIVSEGFSSVEKKQLEHHMRLQSLEEVNRSEKQAKAESTGWKFLLYSAAISPILGVVLELLLHSLLHK